MPSDRSARVGRGGCERGYHRPRVYTRGVSPTLVNEHCVPCEGNTPPTSVDEARELLAELDGHWRLAEDGRVLTREITFKTFGRAVAFLNRLAEVAEHEGHHPDFCLKRWNHLSLALTTHAIGGLSRNDFVLAAKLETIIKPPPGG